MRRIIAVGLVVSFLFAAGAQAAGMPHVKELRGGGAASNFATQ